MLLPLIAGVPRPLAMAAAPVLFQAARHLSTRESRSGSPSREKKETSFDLSPPLRARHALIAPSSDPPLIQSNITTVPTTTSRAARAACHLAAPAQKGPAPTAPPPTRAVAATAQAGTGRRRFLATTTPTSPNPQDKPKKPTAELLAEAHAVAAQPAATALPALRALAADLTAAAPSLTPRQLAILLPALARAGMSDRAFRDAACAALVARIDELTPPELADAAFSLARGLGHDHQLLTAVVERAASDPSAFGTSSLSKILWACARLSYQHDALPDLLEHVVGACVGASDSAEAVAEVAKAAGALDWSDDRLHAAIATYASTHTHVFDGHGIAKLLSGLVAVGFDDPQLFEKLAARAAEHAVKGELAPSDAARIAWALGEGGIWSPPLLSAISEHLLEPAGRLAAFTPADLQTVVRAANKLNYCSPAIASAAAALTDRLLPCLEPLPADDDGHAPGVSAIDHVWTPMQSPPPPPSSSSSPHHPHH
jgi:hypothetical protein